jgi:DNA processing protein
MKACFMDLLSRLALTFTPGIGGTLARSLISYCGGEEHIFKMPRHKLLRIPGIGEKTVNYITQHKDAFNRAEEELKFVEKNNIKILFFSDCAYPKRLRLCEDAPILLYFKGNADLNHTPIISVVGTRMATEYGRDICNKLIEDLKSLHVVVVSGLAYGIDYATHRACIKHEVATVGVLGHGLDRLYPAQHRSIAEKMIEQGGLLTEFPTGGKPDRENFPKRNRIIAGMADATIVVEAGIKGGALITAEIADSYNRDVFAFPGRIGDEYSEGCNYLIRNNKAMMLTGTADLLFAMGWDNENSLPVKQQMVLPIDLTVSEKLIFDQLKIRGQMSIDDLALQINMPVSVLAMNLLNLEMQNIIRCLPGKTYSLN